MRACSFFLPILNDADSASNSSCFLKTTKGANLDSFLFFCMKELLSEMKHLEMSFISSRQ